MASTKCYNMSINQHNKAKAQVSHVLNYASAAHIATSMTRIENAAAVNRLWAALIHMSNLLWPRKQDTKATTHLYSVGSFPLYVIGFHWFSRMREYMITVFCALNDVVDTLIQAMPCDLRR